MLARARCVEGSLGGVRVTQAQIGDQELRIKTQLKTASALTNIGNRYKEFGLKQHADGKYQQAMTLCEEISTEAAKLGGRTLDRQEQREQLRFVGDACIFAKGATERQMLRPGLCRQLCRVGCQKREWPFIIPAVFGKIEMDATDEMPRWALPLKKRLDRSLRRRPSERSRIHPQFRRGGRARDEGRGADRARNPFRSRCLDRRGRGPGGPTLS